MEKNCLRDYMDACELIKETERDLMRLKRRKALGEQGDEGRFLKRSGDRKIERDSRNTLKEGAALRQHDREEEILEERRAKAEEIKTDVEAWMNGVPARLQRIIRFKFFEGLSWEETAARIGRQATGESVKKEFQRFMKEKAIRS